MNYWCNALGTGNILTVDCLKHRYEVEFPDDPLPLTQLRALGERVAESYGGAKDMGMAAAKVRFCWVFLSFLGGQRSRQRAWANRMGGGGACVAGRGFESAAA